MSTITFKDVTPDLSSLSLSAGDDVAGKRSFLALNDDVKGIIFSFLSNNAIVNLLFECYAIKDKKLLHYFGGLINTQRAFPGNKDYEANQSATLLLQICSEESVDIEMLNFILYLPGVDVNITNHEMFRLTPLIVAATTACDGGEVCKALIAAGAKTDVLASEGSTALIKCAQQGHLDNAKVLVQSGCDLKIKNRKKGLSAIMYAAQRGNADIIALLADAEPSIINETNADGYTPLMIASSAGKNNTVKALIDRGCDLNYKNASKQQYTALLTATIRLYGPGRGGADVEEGHTEVALTLIDAGANLEIRGPLVTDTALFHAIKAGNDAVVTALIAAKADLGPKEKGETGLYYACHCGVFRIALLLMKSGEYLNWQRPGDGQTALHEATAKNSTSIALELISKGANVNLLAVNGNSALCYATTTTNFRVCEALIAAGANVNYENKTNSGLTQLPYLVKLGQVQSQDSDQIAIALINAGSDLDQVNGEGLTPLHYAAKLGRTELARALIDKGAQLNIEDNEGLTPLAIVCQEVISFLKSAGAIQRKNRLREARAEIEQLLRDAGAVGSM